MQIKTLVLSAAILLESSVFAEQKPILLFELNYGASANLVALGGQTVSNSTGNSATVTSALSNTIAALLAIRNAGYGVYALVDPCDASEYEGNIINPSSPYAATRAYYQPTNTYSAYVSKHQPLILVLNQLVQAGIPFYFDVYSSDEFQGDPRSNICFGTDSAHGITLSSTGSDTDPTSLNFYVANYQDYFAGMRAHETGHSALYRLRNTVTGTIALDANGNALPSFKVLDSNGNSVPSASNFFDATKLNGFATFGASHKIYGGTSVRPLIVSDMIWDSPEFINNPSLFPQETDPNTYQPWSTAGSYDYSYQFITYWKSMVQNIMLSTPSEVIPMFANNEGEWTYRISNPWGIPTWFQLLTGASSPFFNTQSSTFSPTGALGFGLSDQSWASGADYIDGNPASLIGNIPGQMQTKVGDVLAFYDSAVANSAGVVQFEPYEYLFNWDENIVNNYSVSTAATTHLDPTTFGFLNGNGCALAQRLEVPQATLVSLGCSGIALAAQNGTNGALVAMGGGMTFRTPWSTASNISWACPAGSVSAYVWTNYNGTVSSAIPAPLSGSVPMSTSTQNWNARNALTVACYTGPGGTGQLYGPVTLSQVVSQY